MIKFKKEETEKLLNTIPTRHPGETSMPGADE
jgi:hypothetical protein